MIRRPPRSTRTDTLFPYPTLFRSSFFHIGGDSILAIRMAARASEAGYTLTPSDVFQLQTIEQLAQLLIAAQPRSRRSSERIFTAELLPEATGSIGAQPRSEERRGGKEWFSTCRYGGSPSQ